VNAWRHGEVGACRSRVRHAPRTVGNLSRPAGSVVYSVIAIQELSGSKLWMDSTAVAVSSPRSFWKTTPS